MYPDLLDVLIAGALLLAGLAMGMGLMGYIGTMRSREEAGRQLAERVQEMQKQVEELREANAKRLPYQSQDAIENATAAVLSIIFEKSMEQDKLQNALEWLQRARDPKGKKKA